MLRPPIKASSAFVLTRLNPQLGRQRVEAKLADAMEKETTEEAALVELLQEAAERYHHSPKTARETSRAWCCPILCTR